MSLRLTIHRCTRQIGGVCIEIEHPGGDRIVLDAVGARDIAERRDPESVEGGFVWSQEAAPGLEVHPLKEGKKLWKQTARLRAVVRRVLAERKELADPRDRGRDGFGRDVQKPVRVMKSNDMDEPLPVED